MYLGQVMETCPCEDCLNGHCILIHRRYCLQYLYGHPQKKERMLIKGELTSPSNLSRAVGLLNVVLMCAMNVINRNSLKKL